MHCHVYLIEKKLSQITRVDCLKFIREKYDLDKYFLKCLNSNNNCSEVISKQPNNVNIYSSQIQINKSVYCASSKPINLASNSIISEIKGDNFNNFIENENKAINCKDEVKIDHLDDRGIVIEDYIEKSQIKNNKEEKEIGSIKKLPSKDSDLDKHDKHDKLDKEDENSQNMNKTNNKSQISNSTNTSPLKKLIKSNHTLKMKDEQEFEIIDEIKECKSINNNHIQNQNYILPGSDRHLKSSVSKLELQKSEKSENLEFIHENEITFRDYMELGISESHKYDKRDFSSLLLESFLMKNKILNLFFKSSLIDPIWNRIILFFTFITLSSFFNAVLYTDDIIENRSLSIIQNNVNIKLYKII